MRLSVSLILLISLLSGGCHRGGGRAKPMHKVDASKTVKVPRTLVSGSAKGDPKTVHAPERPVQTAKRSHEDGVSRDFKAVHRPNVPPPEPRHEHTPVGSSAKAVPASRKDSRLVSESASEPPKKVSKHVASGKRKSAEMISAGIEGNHKESAVHEPAARPPEVSVTEPVPPGVSAASLESKRVETPEPSLPAVAQGPAKPVEEPVAPAEAKESAPVPPTAPSSEEPAEKGTKTALAKPETPEPIETLKLEDKPATGEVVQDRPVAPAVSKPPASSKPAISAEATASKVKLTAAEKKKQTEIQKKEEIQKAAEQSYEAGLQFIRESRDSDAIKAFRQTVKLAPESADAWLRLAYLCEKEGKTEEALRAFKEAKRLWSF